MRSILEISNLSISVASMEESRIEDSTALMISTEWTDLLAKQKFRFLDYKEFSVPESLCESRVSSLV